MRFGRRTLADSKLASEVIAACRESNAALNSALIQVQSQAVAAEFEAVRDRIAKVLSAILLDVMDPIYRKHPDLVPTERRSTYDRRGDA